MRPVPARENASITGAFGRLLLFWVLLHAPASTIWAAQPETGAACAMPPGVYTVDVERVVDGDTIVTGDGDTVRIIGIDTPEPGRRGEPDEPFAREAAEHLRTLVGLAGGRVTLADGEESHDRYGRILARVFTPRHGDLAAHLAGNGLGFAVVIAPNTSGAVCHFDAERRAREAGAGLWHDPGAVIVRAGGLEDTGFAIVRGTVTGVRVRRDDTLLSLDGTLTVRLQRGGFDDDPRALEGRDVEVRGWVHPWRGGSLAVTVSHPAMITVHLPYDI